MELIINYWEDHVLRIVIKYTKKGKIRYISHLDTLRVLQRAVRRAKLPIKFSEGFNPHAKISIAYPLSLGLESEGEYAEIEFTQKMRLTDVQERLQKCLPQGMEIIGIYTYQLSASLASLVSHQIYGFKVQIENTLDTVNVVQQILEITQQAYTIKREKKKRNKRVYKEINVIDFVEDVSVHSVQGDMLSINIKVKATDIGSLKVEELKTWIREKVDGIEIRKISRVDLNFIDKSWLIEYN